MVEKNVKNIENKFLFTKIIIIIIFNKQKVNTNFIKVKFRKIFYSKKFFSNIFYF